MDARAQNLLDAYDRGGQIAPFSDRAGFDLDQGYVIAADIHGARLARGDVARGRKIGFTNRTIWPIYNVHAPVWGWVYGSTLGDIPADGVIELPHLPELRIEPEIALGFAQAPEPGMDLAALAGCIEWVAHSIELVFSVYPGWRFTAPDTAAAFSMHGALWLGEQVAAGDILGPDITGLDDFALVLEGGGERLRGHSSDVLGGPMQALAHLVETLAAQSAQPLVAGEVVTTGTLTDARPITTGQRWTTQITGCALPGLSVAFV